MESIRILLLRPESDDPSPIDQSLGARLSALKGSAGSDVVVEEENFQREDLAGMQSKLALWTGKVAGVIGATNVPESTRLGELAERMDLLCFVANNNPIVWQQRSHVFHIGFPSSQTALAVAVLLGKTRRRRIFLLHDQTEFQRRVAASMEVALREHDMEASSRAASAEGEFESVKDWQPDLIYVVFSSESKALPVARKLRQLSQVPLLFGRSLLRQSFLSSLDENIGEAWFVDMFHRNGTQPRNQRHFMQMLSAHGVNVPTANHAFGWDAMSFCALALKAGGGKSSLAIEHLESRVTLDGATGTCSFSHDNHNGRAGFGPTTLTRWHKGKLEEVNETL